MRRGQKPIQSVVRRIVRRFHPDQVVLFGSQARGDAGPDSDVDLLVVMPVIGAKREKESEVRAAVGGIGIPVHVFVSTPQELALRRHIPGTIERPACLEGKVLYSNPGLLGRGATRVTSQDLAEERRHVIRSWIRKAEGDFAFSVRTVRMRREGLAHSVAFHAQQSVQKYLQALLVQCDFDYPRTDDVGVLRGLLPSRLRPAFSDGDRKRWLEYATVILYPGDHEPVAVAEARRAVAIARRVRREVRRHLPLAVRRRKRSPS